ncbi:hypothetical protein SAMN05216582_11844 [Selenomonas ruminantium]|uniref:Uncharacterized protein n=2 Tax=Selenomonas ruminantium TaxID=971 RepID=A0A1M6VFR2_SELRU|nr:hypothetical protein SAMN05216582_11844 [Selenomonas ruminantium]
MPEAAGIMETIGDEAMKTDLEEIKAITIGHFGSLSLDHADLPAIYASIPAPMKMTWFKLCCDCMDLEDYSLYLKKSWLDEEDPNQDANVSREEIVAYFRKATKLMNAAEQAYFDALPDKITIYRGVSPHRAVYGLSWTPDHEIAMRYKRRYETGEVQGEMLTATIDKKHALCYIDELQERELVVDVFRIRNQIETMS